MIELLAPAGDLERLKIAFTYGADAVYIGGKNFSLRANALNFSLEDMKKGVEYAHKLNKKVYVTVNIVFHNENLDGLDEYLIYLNTIKVDGIIASDIVVLERVKELKLDLFIVLSTQASVLNHETVKFYQSLGVKRIVLAREASKKDIETIIKNTGVEVEAFIHGAMCISFSGKCVMSNITTNRDANRGGCAQVCRFVFNVNDLPNFNMMAKDLNMVTNIKEMIDVGVISFKVEGRMRSIYYIATVISTYRAIIDKVLNNTLSKNDVKYYLNILNRVANRESKEQFFSSKTDYNDQYFSERKEETNKDFLGIVKKYKNNFIYLEQRNYFKKGDNVEFMLPNGEIIKYKVDKIINELDEEIEVANHPLMKIKLPFHKEIPQHSMMRFCSIDKDEYI